MTRDTEDERSEKHLLARRRVPDELKEVFDAFVDDYKFSAAGHYGTPFVSYEVLADMVLAGWRKSASGRLPD